MKIEDQVLSIGQVKNLKSLGLDTNIGEFAWINYIQHYIQHDKNARKSFVAPINLIMHDNYTPTLSTSEIMYEILPSYLTHKDGREFEFVIEGTMNASVGYYNKQSDTYMFRFRRRLLRDALYELLIEMINNKTLK